jgi:hypothetical protein
MILALRCVEKMMIRSSVRMHVKCAQLKEMNQMKNVLVVNIVVIVKNVEIKKATKKMMKKRMKRMMKKMMKRMMKRMMKKMMKRMRKKMMKRMMTRMMKKMREKMMI